MRPARPAAGGVPAGQDPADTDPPGADVAEPEVLPVLPDPVPTDAERALARFGLLDCARQVYGRLRSGFYGLEVMLVVLVFMALLRRAR